MTVALSAACAGVPEAKGKTCKNCTGQTSFGPCIHSCHEGHCCPSIQDNDTKGQLRVAESHLSYAAVLVEKLRDGTAHEGTAAEAEYDALHGLQHLRKALASTKGARVKP